MIGSKRSQRGAAQSRCVLMALVAVSTLLATSTSLFGQDGTALRPGYVQVDDEILPESALVADSTFNATVWPGGLVYYAFDANVNATNQARAIEAMAEWSSVANVAFALRTNQSDYVYFIDSNSNSSYVGMIGGQQPINIYNWTYRFIIAHELCHALGFLHEQQRPDRNTYVTINSGNITSGYAGNFSIVGSSQTYGVYDFDSIMHYPQYAFSSNGQPTITCNAGYTQFQSTMGQRQHMSPLDAQGVANRYGVAPPPAITSINPTSANLNGAGFTLTVNGSRFHAGTLDGAGVAGSVVRWNGVDLVTTYVNDTQITAAVSSSLLVTAGTATITVANVSPGGGTSAGTSFSINNPTPALLSINPSSVAAGGPNLSLTLSGSGFTNQSVVQFNGVSIATTYLSSVVLLATVPAASIASGGTGSVTVQNPAPGGGTSVARTLTVNNPSPTVSSLNPTSKVAGAAAFTLTVNGNGYNAQSIVKWNGSSLTTTYVSAMQLTASVSAALVAAAGTAPVTVFNPSPAGGTSGPATFTIDHVAPTLTSMNPTSATAGAAGFTITVSGGGYDAQSVIRWNGTGLATTLVSTSVMTAPVSAALVASVGSASVTVFAPAPGGGTSPPIAFPVLAPSMTSIAPSSIAIMSPGTTPVTIVVTGARFLAGAKVFGNGIQLTTTYVNATTLNCAVGPSIPQALIAGGIALTVQNAPLAISNTMALRVGAGGNKGTLVTNPLQHPLAPGAAFELRLEGGVPGAPFSLLMADATTPVVTSFPSPAADFVLGVGGPSTTAPLDGLGLFSPPNPLAAFGAVATGTAPGGVFVLPGIAMPSPALGLTVTLQVIYLDASSPVGWRLGWASWPQPL